ncbi:MAG TPA: exodeoxyribonuclease VII small subunit [Clostridiaceae bacterium]|nr:exodeoxyribonuclease VII small subunit [Clostridiaceae bacterium]
MEIDNMSFEDIMKSLESIANELESGKLNLDESVEKFEEGIKLSKKCNEILDKAEKKISMLVSGNENEVKEQDFNIESN